MAKRASSTPLYEVMSSRHEAAGRRIDEPAAGGVAATPSGADLITGRSVRVPIGYLLLAVAGMLLLLLAAYMVGAWHGAENARAEIDQGFLDAAGPAGAGWQADDPIGGTPGSPAGVSDAGRDEPPTTPSPTATGSPAPGPTAANGWRSVESNPVEPGLYYFVLVETRSEGALRLAGFCRERGLEAYVVQGNNGRLRRVVVLPGFSTSSRSDPAVRRLEDEIHRVGRLWKERYPGESDLGDAYLAQP